MRAATYSQYSSDVDTIEVQDLPEPKVFPGSVLVEVRAAGVNPVDWKAMAGGLDALIDASFPVIPGWDVAGVVIAVGMDTPEFQVGDPVMAYARKDVLGAGTFAERVAIPAAATTDKPNSLTWEQAAALPLAGGTALRSVDALGVIAERTVLIHAASGGVGAFAVQIARSRGARVIGTASERNHDFLRELGAEPVSYGQGLTERVRGLAPEGVDAVADFVGGQLETTLSVLTPDGAHVSTVDDDVLAHGGRVIWVRPDGNETARLADLADRGELDVEVAGVYSLDQVPEAFRISRAGHVRGKIVIVP